MEFDKERNIAEEECEQQNREVIQKDGIKECEEEKDNKEKDKFEDEIGENEDCKDKTSEGEPANENEMIECDEESNKAEEEFEQQNREESQKDGMKKSKEEKDGNEKDKLRDEITENGDCEDKNKSNKASKENEMMECDEEPNKATFVKKKQIPQPQSDSDKKAEDSQQSKAKGRSMTPDKKTGWLMGCGAVLVVIGAVVVVFWPAIFLGVLQGLLVVTPTSASFNIWRHPDIPMYMEFYFFNITNVDEILDKQNVSIKVAQMGPYVYEEDGVKTNLTWNDNSTISFFLNRTWHFRPELSNGSESDMVTSINPIIATVAYIVRYQSPLIKFPVDVMLRLFHDNLFLTANVSSWVFEGIDDELLDVIEHFPDFPINIPYDKFGWFYTRNASETYEGEFVMNTGASDFSRLGDTEMWRGSNRSVFRGECGEVRGSRGELWALDDDQEEIVIWVSDICTSLALSKNGSKELLGISGVEFTANSSLFDNGYNYPARACYCAEVRDENCLPPGYLNVSSCRYGAPAFVSLPHFYNSDPYYPSKIEGLEPNESHNFRMTLETYTGIPLAVSAQMQINMLIRHIPDISINNQLPDPDTLVPMFWFRQEIEMTPSYARLARMALNFRDAMPYALYALTVIGVSLLVAGIVILVRKIMRSPDTAPILQETDES